MAESGILEQTLSLYLEGDRSDTQEQYEELFTARFMGDDVERDPSVTEEDDIDTILAGLFGQVRLPEAIEQQISDEWDKIEEPDRVHALYHLAILGSLVDNQGWTFPYILEGMVNFFGVRIATCALHSLSPECAFPIDSEQRYDRFRRILATLGIKYDDGEDLFPSEIASNIRYAVEALREERDLEDWQVWALVYDLGPRLLPPPAPYPADQAPRIWLSAAGPENFVHVDNRTDIDTDRWSINPKARRGDIVLMYCLAPRSSIVGVYRCGCDAYRDPFDQWWTGVWSEITDRLAIPALSYNEMKSDPVLCDWHMVRMRFRGMLKHQVPEEVWARIKELVAERDPEAGGLLEQYAESPEGIRTLEADVVSEKAFEDQVMIPLLEKLGWDLGRHLRRQYELDIKVGSGAPRRVRADLVGFRDPVAQDGLVVVECKRSIRSEEELRSAVEQCESYAGKLRTSRFAVAAPEGLWVYDLAFPTQSQLLTKIELGTTVSQQPMKEIQEYVGFEELLISSRVAGRAVE